MSTTVRTEATVSPKGRPEHRIVIETPEATLSMLPSEARALCRDLTTTLSEMGHTGSGFRFTRDHHERDDA